MPQKATANLLGALIALNEMNACPLQAAKKWSGQHKNHPLPRNSEKKETA